MYNVLRGHNQDSFDTVAKIRQTPSGESASRNFAYCVCKIRSQNDPCIWMDQPKDAASLMIYISLAKRLAPTQLAAASWC